MPQGKLSMILPKKSKEREPIITTGRIVYQRQFGDLLIWKQILKHAEVNKLKSIVLLTNDVKEDWLLKISGKTIGPRPELREEIHRLSGVERFHIYTSEQFLRIAQEYLDIKVSEDSLNAAKDMLHWFRRPSRPSLRHSPTLSFPEQIVEEILSEFISDDLINGDDIVTSTMAETNALGYGLDTFEVISAEYDTESDLIEFEADIHLSGEQDVEKGYCGNAIDIEISGTIKYESGCWLIEDYEITKCDISDY
ncbi:PIN-like domain-containing protein [Chloroflexota bacterium]